MACLQTGDGETLRAAVDLTFDHIETATDSSGPRRRHSPAAGVVYRQIKTCLFVAIPSYRVIHSF